RHAPVLEREHVGVGSAPDGKGEPRRRVRVRSRADWLVPDHGRRRGDGPVGDCLRQHCRRRGRRRPPNAHSPLPPPATTGVPGATVSIGFLSTTTDTEGDYSFPVVPLGPVTVSASHPPTHGLGRASGT